ncbi:VOC family protein [Aminithiophilus ramosus]|uniref:VOC family protein n=2 Tax=Synergistales TaxID=649776 RepID=A0A9Q7AE89_9BACT|nr:VOC family protein [Aminithiophilus ramosus]QTX31729.1 VOC family protein [Aminithiophilus ramosus]QVL35552.1 VOC family protein [Synergistota bacterium]
MAFLAHVGLLVRDLDRSRRFYVDVLGCRERRSVDRPGTRLLFLESGSSLIELVEKAGRPYPEVSCPTIHLAFQVDSVADEIARLKVLGLSLDSEEPIPFGGKSIFFFSGPDGERIELCEPLE